MSRKILKTKGDFRCTCIEQCNKQLEEMGENAVIDVPLRINFASGTSYPPQCFIAVVKRDQKNRKKPIALVAAYCPMCGRKYEEDDA